MEISDKHNIHCVGLTIQWIEIYDVGQAQMGCILVALLKIRFDDVKEIQQPLCCVVNMADWNLQCQGKPHPLCCVINMADGSSLCL